MKPLKLDHSYYDRKVSMTFEKLEMSHEDNPLKYNNGIPHLGWYPSGVHEYVSVELSNVYLWKYIHSLRRTVKDENAWYFVHTDNLRFFGTFKQRNRGYLFIVDHIQ